MYLLKNFTVETNFVDENGLNAVFMCFFGDYVFYIAGTVNMRPFIQQRINRFHFNA